MDLSRIVYLTYSKTETLLRAVIEPDLEKKYPQSFAAGANAQTDLSLCWAPYRLAGLKVLE